MSTVIELWTDGSCFKGKYAWAYMIIRNDILIKKDSGLCHCKNNAEAEIIAIINGLINIPESISMNTVSVKCDNKSIVFQMSRGLRFANSPNINKKLIKELGNLSDKYTVSWQHIYSHSGIKYNTKVDSMTRKVILQI